MAQDAGDQDLFDKMVEEHGYLLSDNAGAARNWIRRDGDGKYVPRPDCSLTTLTVISVALGLFGIDHFYVRSPVTGIAKMLTGGGLGLWWLWDVLQLVCERDRVLKYGMSTPFDFITGIGQGMITDLKSNYTSASSYSLWVFCIMFGFLGLDSLVAKNGGQFLRKLMEFSLFMMFLMYVVRVYYTGITFRWVIALICMCYLASIIIVEYISVATIVFGGDVFKTGVEVSPEEDLQYNSLFKWMINAVNDYFLPKERKEQIIKDLQYGGISAPEINQMFEIFHASETSDRAKEKREKAKAAVDPGHEKWGSWISFLCLILSPFIILISAIYSLFVMIWEATPWGRASKMANALATGKLPIPGQFAKGLQGFDKILQKPSALSQTSAGQLFGDKVKGVTANPLASSLLASASANPLASAKSFIDVASTVPPAPAKPQKGGARSDTDLSLEAQIMGASVIALIAGGSLKGLVDYLMVE
jgi:TM2 domain-containing membrane protein YozV